MEVVISVSSLMKHYKLPEGNCNQQISDSHLQKISHSHCEKWRSLPTHLKMEEIITKDIDRESKGEDEKRLAFFKRWQQEKGSDATYKQLIYALLEISCRQDAEKVCELLQKSLSDPPAPLGDDAIPDSKKPEESSNSISKGNIRPLHYVLRSQPSLRKECLFSDVNFLLSSYLALTLVNDAKQCHF